MTEERMALKALLEKTSDADVLNEMIGFAANRLMALEADALCNAAGTNGPPIVSTIVSAIATGCGIPAPARSSCRSRS